MGSFPPARPFANPMPVPSTFDTKPTTMNTMPMIVQIIMMMAGTLTFSMAALGSKPP